MIFCTYFLFGFHDPISVLSFSDFIINIGADRTECLVLALERRRRRRGGGIALAPLPIFCSPLAFFTVVATPLSCDFQAPPPPPPPRSRSKFSHLVSLQRNTCGKLFAAAGRRRLFCFRKCSTNSRHTLRTGWSISSGTYLASERMNKKVQLHVMFFVVIGVKICCEGLPRGPPVSEVTGHLARPQLQPTSHPLSPSYPLDRCRARTIVWRRRCNRPAM